MKLLQHKYNYRFINNIINNNYNQIVKFAKYKLI